MIAFLMINGRNSRIVIAKKLESLFAESQDFSASVSAIV